MEITDLLVISEEIDDLPLLIRRVRVVSGSAKIHLRCAVRHDYARTPTQASLDDGIVYFAADGLPGVRLASSHALQIEDNAAVASFTLAQEEGAEFVLGGQDDPRVNNGCTDLALAHTLKFWRCWKRSALRRRPTSFRRACPAASNSAWPLPGRWRWNPR